MLPRTLLAALAVTIALLALGGRDAAASHTCNPGLAIDSDSDGLPFTCDPNDSQPDIDGDGFEDSLEVFVGTSPLLLCSYPADINGDGRVDIIDVNTLRPPVFLSTADDPFYKARYNLNADGIIDIFDVNVMRPPIAFSSCPFPVHWSTAIARLRSGTVHLSVSQVWASDTAFLSFQSSSFPTSCSELERAGSHWSNTTDFTFSLALDAGGSCINVVSSVRAKWDVLPCGPDTCTHAGVKLFESLFGPECTDSSPCHFASFAAVLLNQNSADMVNDSSFRHFALPHELGHVVGQGHTQNAPCSPIWSIMTEPFQCRFQSGVHRPMPNDVLFTNVKY